MNRKWEETLRRRSNVFSRWGRGNSYSGGGGVIFNSGGGGVLSIIIGLQLAPSLRTCRRI